MASVSDLPLDSYAEGNSFKNTVKSFIILIKSKENMKKVNIEEMNEIYKKYNPLYLKKMI